MPELEIEKTSLDHTLLIKPPAIFKDFHGEYAETYNETLYQQAGVSIRFIEDDISISKKNVLRGIHGDRWPVSDPILSERDSGKVS